MSRTTAFGKAQTLFASFAMAALAACDVLPVPDDVARASAPSEPLTQASMARGKVTLVPPQGYCIDGANLRPRFALMARCDTLAGGQSGQGAPVGILTVSFSPATANTLPTAEITATALGLQNVTSVRTDDNAVIFRAEGTPSIESMGKAQWRGTARVADQIMGLALYGPAGSRALSEEGRAMLAEVIAGTRAAE